MFELLLFTICYILIVYWKIIKPFVSIITNYAPIHVYVFVLYTLLLGLISINMYTFVATGYRPKFIHGHLKYQHLIRMCIAAWLKVDQIVFYAQNEHRSAPSHLLIKSLPNKPIDRSNLCRQTSQTDKPLIDPHALNGASINANTTWLWLWLCRRRASIWRRPFGWT